MRTKNEKNVDKLMDYFNRIIINVQYNNNLGQYDFSKELEIITKNLMNYLFKLKLKRLEVAQKNFPSIDLSDQEKSIAVQVTTQSTKQKITSTLDKFNNYDLSKKYSKLVFFIWSTNKITSKIHSEIEFCVIYPETYINHFKDAKLKKQKKILSYLKLQLKEINDHSIKSIATNREVTLPLNLKRLTNILTVADYDINDSLKKDIDLAINQIAKNLPLLSSQERSLLVDCLNQAEIVDEEYLLLTQNIGYKIAQNGLSNDYEALEQRGFIESEFEYGDTETKVGAIFILNPKGSSSHLNWLWVLIKQEYNKSEIQDFIKKMDFRLFEG